MRKMLLCCVSLLVGATTGYTQQWPAYPAPYHGMQHPIQYQPGMPPMGNGQFGPHYQGYAPAPHAAHYQQTPAYYQPAPNAGQTGSGYYDDGPVYYFTSVEKSSGPALTLATATVTVPMSSKEKFVVNRVVNHGGHVIEHPPYQIVDHPPYQEAVGAYCPPDVPCVPEIPREPVQRKDKFWGSIGLTTSWIKSMNVPVPLVTTSSGLDPIPGAVGQPGTRILAGNEFLGFGTLPGIKGEMGAWLDRDNRHALELGGFYIFQGGAKKGFASGPGGTPAIFRPAFDLTTNQNTAFINAAPGLAAGGSVIEADSEVFGLELNTRHRACIGRHGRIQGLLGFRFLNLDETITVTDRVMPLVGNVFTFGGNTNFVNPPNQLMDTDTFGTVNRFYGFQIGGEIGWDLDELNMYLFRTDKFQSRIDFFAKVGLGFTSQDIEVKGETTMITPTGSQTIQGGILALPSTAGDQSRTEFSVVPEFGVNFGVELTKHIRLKTGYSFLFWTHVVRPGDQINGRVTPSQIPTDQTFVAPPAPPRNAFAFVDEVFTIHNLFFGFEFHR